MGFQVALWINYCESVLLSRVILVAWYYVAFD